MQMCVRAEETGPEFPRKAYCRIVLFFLPSLKLLHNADLS